MAGQVDCVIDTGGTGDYTTHNAAEAASYGATGADLEGNFENVAGSFQCTDGNADTTVVEIDGQTTTAVYNIVLTVDAAYRYTGKYVPAGNTYRMSVSGSPMQIKDNYVELHYVPVRITGSTIDLYGIRIRNAGNCWLNGCLAFDDEGNINGRNGIVVYGDNSNSYGDNWVTNCIAIDFKGTGAEAFLGYNTKAGDNVYFYNCTAVNSVVGFQVHATNAGKLICKNCLAHANTTDYAGVWDPTSCNNGYTDGGAAPTYGYDAVWLNSDADVVFNDYGTDELKLGPSSEALKAGANLYSDTNKPVTVDALGNPRYANVDFDIGAFQRTTDVSQTQQDNEIIDLLYCLLAKTGS